MFALSRSDLDAALKHHKEAAQILRLRADQIIRENAARQAKQRFAEQEAKKSAKLLDATSGARNRRLSSASSGDSSMTVGGKKRRSTSAQSKRRLSVVSEDKVLQKLCSLEFKFRLRVTGAFAGSAPRMFAM